MSEIAVFGNCVEKTPGAQIRLAGPTFPKVTQSEIFDFFSFYFIYNHDICILLIKTNSMIYICYIFCWGGVEICLLTVRDNEHSIGDNVGDIAEGVDKCGKALGSHTGRN